MRFFEKKSAPDATPEVRAAESHTTKEVAVASGDGNGIFSGSDQSRLSLEAQNEKEVEAHPDEVTKDAQLGVQKVEAAALVWSKQAVYATYAWWVFFLEACSTACLTVAAT